MRDRMRGPRYATADQQVGFYDSVLARVKQLPGVQAAAVSTDVALSGEREYSGTTYQVAGRPAVPEAQRPGAKITIVSREFFSTMRIPVLAGRVFTDEDSPKGTNAVIVNEAFARQAFGGGDPLRQRLLLGRDGTGTIAGVVGNIRGAELGAEPQPLIYRCTCYRSDPFVTALRFIVRTDNDPRASLKAVESEVYAADPGLPVFEVLTMEERLDSALAPRRFQLILIGVFAGIAIVLAAVGIYGVMSYLVTRQTREIGIRIALGARPAQVQEAVMRESLALACAAAAAGLAGAWALTRYLKTMLYGVSEVDSLTFAAMPVALALIAALAAFIPARRAARIDPIAALRDE
jgi:putative ABC transport system permease protein